MMNIQVKYNSKGYHGNAITDHDALSRFPHNICITFVQCWNNVEDVGPTLYKCYTNVV